MQASQRIKLPQETPITPSTPERVAQPEDSALVAALRHECSQLRADCKAGASAQEQIPKLAAELAARVGQGAVLPLSEEVYG